MALNVTIKRRETRTVTVGGVKIGSKAPVSIQSMTTTRTEDAEATLSQIRALHKAGCEIVRVAVPSHESIAALRQIKRSSPIPVIADIHFDHELAILAAQNGADCVRINPGNINGEPRVTSVIDACKKGGVPVRIGVNSGSLEKDILAKYGRPSPEALVASATRWISFFERAGFNHFKISIKSSSPVDTVHSYRLLSKKTEVPFHLGLTEAGTLKSGSIKSAVTLGALLVDGIGDTIRVSLADDPVKEIGVAKGILSSLGLRSFGADVIACPQCGRCSIDVSALAVEVEEKLSLPKYAGLKVAVMGCAVNGPGEAMEADFGLAGGQNEVLIFKKGQPIKKAPAGAGAQELLAEIEKDFTSGLRR